MKKIIFSLACVAFVALFLTPVKATAFATTEEENEKQIIEHIDERLDEIDLSELEKYYEENVNFESFSDISLKNILLQVISGETTLNFEDMINLIFSSISIEFESVIKLITLIVVIAGFGSFSEMLQSEKNKSGVGKITSLIILTAVLAVVTTIIADFVSETVEFLTSMREVGEAVFPVLVSLVVALGGANASLKIQPAIVFLTGGVTTIISSLTIFAVMLYFVLSVVGELTDNLKLDRMKSLVSSIFKWGVGLVFTVFMGYMTLNGIIASGRDGLTIKTAKYALKNYIPMVGGYISDSYELFRVGSELIKNSIGVVGVVVIFGMAIKYVVSLGVYKLGFMLASGITEPLGTNKISRFLSSLSTLLNFLIVGLVASFLMIVITIFILMSIVGV